MKKTIAALAAAVLLAAALSTAASARGHGAGHIGGAHTAKLSVCGIKNCTLSGIHTHNRTACAAHFYGDGHDYHVYCTFEDCALTGYHEHGGIYCFGQTPDDGHEYRKSGHGGGKHH